MSSSHGNLDAASTDRKARLAKLASLKRKHPESDTGSTPKDDQQKNGSESTNVYLSGRNYDKDTRAPKLGFQNAPDLDENTVEQQAERLTLAAADQAAKDELEAERGLDLFNLQPKKPNWDLKRDLAEKRRVLDVRTQNAIARLVRERIQGQKKLSLEKESAVSDTGAEEVGMSGSTLVEGVHLREREDEEAERKLQELGDEDIA